MPFFSVTLAADTFNLIGRARTLFAACVRHGPKCQSPPHTLEGVICPSSGGAGKKPIEGIRARSPRADCVDTRELFAAVTVGRGLKVSRRLGMVRNVATLTSMSKRTNPPFVTSESRARPLYRARARDKALCGVQTQNRQISLQSCGF